MTKERIGFVLQGLLLVGLIVVVVSALAFMPRPEIPTVHQGMNDILFDHPECADEVIITRQGGVALWGGYSDFQYFLECKQANVKIKVNVN